MLTPINQAPTVQEEKYLIIDNREIDGIEMGVLENGIPYLTQNGLARLCGIDPSSINQIAMQWANGSNSERLKMIADKLKDVALDFRDKTLYFKGISKNSNIVVNAYPDVVCLAILEYYAFDAPEANRKEHARDSYRLLARVSFKDFVYKAIGYNPECYKLTDAWKQYTGRVRLLLDSVPDGYWCVFREISSLIMELICNDVPIGPNIVPDISIGKTWINHWNKINGEETYGPSCTFKHNYPEGFEQAKSNPQIVHAYPDNALPEFRKWFKTIYLTTKYPAYIMNTKLSLTPLLAQKAKEIIAKKYPDIRKITTNKNRRKKNQHNKEI